MTIPEPFGRLFFVLSGVLASFSAGCGPTGFLIQPVSTDKTLEEHILERDGGFGEKKVVLVDVDGVLLNGRLPGFFSAGEHPVSLLLEKLRRAEGDPQVKGLILRINSPGGTVTASDLMHHEIEGYRKRTGNPVVTVMMDVAASGGYYIACATNHIVAHRSTVTGSIGVIMQMINVSGTMDKIGITSEAIKSGKMKDAGSPFREMNDSEREIFQGVIDDFYGRFVEVVQSGRPQLSEVRIRELADGRVYTGSQALENGLVDQIGTLSDGLAKIRELSGIERVRVVTYQRPLGWSPNIYAGLGSLASGQPITVELQLPGWLRQPSPRFMYLWAPGF
jgi:protease-4